MAFALKGAGSASTDWSVTANQSSFVLTTSTTAGAANDLAVLLYAVDNNATVDGDEVAVTGVTDSAGNFWQKAVEFTNGQGTAQTGATNGIWYCNLQNALAIGATVTLAFSNNTSRDAAAVSLTYFTKAAGFKAAVEATNTLANDAANAGSLDATTANIACLRIRAIASESSTATAITKTAAFTAVLTQAISTGGTSASNQGVRGEYLISTATGAASAPTGGAGAVDHASVYAAFREDAFFVGDPPHNSDQVAGAQVATIARKAVTAALIAASAGLFQTPYPRGNDPALTTGVPVTTGGAAPRARKVYYQAAFITPYAAPAAAATPAPQGWQAPLSGAPKVASAQPGYASVPYDTAQLSVNFTNFGWHAPTSTAPPVAKAQPGNSFVPFNTRQLSVNFTNYGWHQALSGAPAVARAQVGNSFVPYNTAQLVAPATEIGVPLNMGDAAPSVRPVYYQSRFETPYLPPVVVAATPNGWQAALSIAPRVARTSQDFGSVPFTSFAAPSVQWQQPLSIPLSPAKAQAGTSSVPYNTAQLSVNFTNVGWQQALSGAPAVAKAQPGYSFVPYNTAQLIVNYTNFGWYQPLSVAVAVAKPQAGFAFVPYNTAQLAVNYSNFGWHQPLAGAPLVAKALQGFSSVPYDTAQIIFNTVTIDKWQVPLSVASAVAKAPVGFSFVPFNTAQLAVNYTIVGWQQPLSIAPPIAKARLADWALPYTIVNVAGVAWQPALSAAPASAKAPQGFAAVPFYPVQPVAGIAGMAWFTPLWSVPTRNLTAPQGNSSVPFNTAQIVVTTPGQRRPTLFIANLGRLMNH